jgi:hypothetical protein
MSRYKVVPSQENNREYDNEFYCGYDVELQTPHHQPSIVSITVSRKEKPDGSIVRIKETFLSNNTSSLEELNVPRRKQTRASPVTRLTTYQPQHHQRQQARPQQSHDHNNSTFATSVTTSKTKHHIMEYLPLDQYPFEPMTIHANAKLPQSRNSQTRLLWYLLCRCTIMMAMLLVICVVAFSLICWNNTDDITELLHKLLNA